MGSWSYNSNHGLYEACMASDCSFIDYANNAYFVFHVTAACTNAVALILTAVGTLDVVVV